MQKRLIVYIALHNLLHKKARSLVTIGGLSVAVAIIVFLLGLGYGIQDLVIKDFTTLDALRTIDVTSEKSEQIELTNETIETFKEDENVDQVYPIVELGAKLRYQDALTDVAVISYSQNTVGIWDSLRFERGFDKTKFTDNNVIVSEAALNLVGIENTDDPDLSMDIITEGYTKDAETIQGDFKLLTTFESETPIVLVPIEYLQESGLTKYSILKVQVDDTDYVTQFRTLTDKAGYKTRTSLDTIDDIKNYFQILRVALALFGSVAVVIALLGMFNTLTVSLMEKMEEIGLMKALGADEETVFRLFIVESIIMTLTSSILGIILGFMLSNYVQGLSRILADIKDIDTQVDFFNFPVDFLIILVTALIGVGMLTGLYPAYKASRTDPLDALRYE